jgi:hypothetical protein
LFISVFPGFVFCPQIFLFFYFIVFFLFKLQCFILGHFTHLENNTCVVIHHALKRLSDRMDNLKGSFSRIILNKRTIILAHFFGSLRIHREFVLFMCICKFCVLSVFVNCCLFLFKWMNTGKKFKLLYIFSKQKVKCFVNIIVFFLFKLQCFILCHFTHLENNTCVVIHHALKRLSDRMDNLKVRD